MITLPPNLSEFIANVASNVVADLLILGAGGALGKVAIFAGRWSLKWRLIIGLGALSVIAISFLWLGLSPVGVIAVFGILSITFAVFVLKDISHVGIVNAFGSTSGGITPVKSLGMAKKKFDFLGIGAKKLTDSEEFAEAARRCSKAGGQIRLLLSSPKNPALAALAQRIGRDSQSYSTRVRESIRQILHIRDQIGGNVVQIKLYELSSSFAFPHFRLMFTDDRICILSHVLWNTSEGLDNPQLIIRSKNAEPEESLYTAYQRYFDDLWDAPESKEIISAQDTRLAL